MARIVEASGDSSGAGLPSAATARVEPVDNTAGSFADRPENHEPVLAAETSELADHLRQALNELDDRQAQVFCLACLEGWSYEEIAGQLDLNVNHVGVLLNRARTILREKLEAFEPAAVRRQREEQS